MKHHRAIVLCALLTLALAGCAGTHPRATIDDVQAVTGVWRGWLITPRDSVPATLDIRPDGRFTLTAPRTRVDGTLRVSEGRLRFDGVARAGGWHGTISLYRHDGGRRLELRRDDRLFPGRFSPATSPS